MNASKYSILLLEDEAITRFLISDFLQELGITTLAVGSFAALTQVLPTDCDLLLADVHLPDGNSLDMLPRLRQQGVLNVEYLVMTADTREESVQHAFAAGASDYLSKPLNLCELKARLDIQFTKMMYQRRLLSVLNALSSAVVLVDKSLRIQHINRAGRELFGSADELLQLPHYRQLHAWLAQPIGTVLSQQTAFFSRWQSPENSQAGLFDIAIHPSFDDRNQVVVVVDDKTEIMPRQSTSSIQGNSPVIKALKQQIDRVARLKWNALITGPSGSGKELVARELHRLSDRSTGPFIALNCAALSEGLLNDQLFGHERGAFTGAHSQYAGVFEQAKGGSLFLDEIADLPMSMQGSLLRVLQERVLTRLGGRLPIAVDARLIFATHKDLQEQVRAGLFREDLFYRINSVVLRVPTLRERGDDAVLLLQNALVAFAQEIDEPVKVLSSDAQNWLVQQSWPGNVRQLEQLARRLALLPQRHLSAEACAAAMDGPSASVEAAPLERQRIEDALLACRGNKTAAAQYLGIGRATLYRKLDQLGL